MVARTEFFEGQVDDGKGWSSEGCFQDSGRGGSGCVRGYFSVEWTLQLVRLRGESLGNGSCGMSLRTGSGEAGMYWRAVVAKHGIWRSR